MASLFDLPFEEPPQPERFVVPRGPLTVTELTADIRSVLESGFADVAVEGELSNCKLWHTGHLYFTLKDAGAQIRGVMFRSAVRTLKFRAEDGQHVVARGRLSVYDAKGEYQIVCEALEPKGLGALQLAFEQLKKRLDQAGLFDPARKRPLPVLPRKIGVVTSLDGAAIRDILSVLAKRYPQAHVVIRPARVQGDGAAQEVARGLQMIARVEGVDVVIVARGGGSIEDLWAFNEEVVARAIAACPVPVISAVGHETDVTIADFVADFRAPTPSAAAERVVARRDEFVARIDRQCERLGAALGRRLLVLRSRVHTLDSSRGLARVPATLALRSRHVGELAQHLRRALADGVRARTRRLIATERALERHDPRRRLAETATRLTAGRARLNAAIERRRSRDIGRFGAVAGRLESLSPLAVLGRGYAVCWDESRTRVIRTVSDVATGDTVRVTLAEGELTCEVRGDVRGPEL
jgi:exodeoxyribonuclease VII large subunit